ncbi:hypothetical protein, partial [Streptomyces sp. GbtcB6]|uniref:hypothetical protein n=1 Tax=Streptomyces sp. GbtcB6 TaxID=2824751 RepID=UPI001C2F8E56
SCTLMARRVGEVYSALAGDGVYPDSDDVALTEMLDEEAEYRNSVECTEDRRYPPGRFSDRPELAEAPRISGGAGFREE